MKGANFSRISIIIQSSVIIPVNFEGYHLKRLHSDVGLSAKSKNLGTFLDESKNLGNTCLLVIGLWAGLFISLIWRYLYTLGTDFFFS